MAFDNRYFAHLLPVDIPVWKRYLAEFSHLYNKIEYDIRVGEGSKPPPELDENIKRMWIDLSKKRIDAVGWRKDSITIIEITRHAGIKAIGQLVVYPILYQQTYLPSLPIKVLLVAEDLISDIRPILTARNIHYILLPGTDV